MQNRATLSTVRDLKFVFLSCRPIDVDFRFALAREISELGYDVTYIELKRTPDIHDVKQLKPAESVSVLDLVKRLRKKCKCEDKVIFFNSTNLSFPLFTVFLKLFLGEMWVFDIHDDLLYDTKGVSRAVGKLKLGLLTLSSDRLVHSAPALKTLFPRSYHLGNASDITPIPTSTRRLDSVLIMASFDERCDFNLIEDVVRTNPNTKFDMFGAVSTSDVVTEGRVRYLTEKYQNVRYFGPYKTNQIRKIVSSYDVTLAPYKVGSHLTKFIDPLRYYHCLAGGMEVVSTGIPQAFHLSEHLHIGGNHNEITAKIQGLKSGRVCRKNNGTLHVKFSWRLKAQALCKLMHQSV